MFDRIRELEKSDAVQDARYKDAIQKAVDKGAPNMSESMVSRRI